MNQAAAIALAGALLLPVAAAAQGTDELWEVSTQMSGAGIPAGMGGQTTQVCQDKDPKKQTVPGQDEGNCKVSNFKQSGTKTSMTVTCPDGTSQIEHIYNAARTEYKGTMKMTSRDGNMTMSMSGRKVGACDAKQAAREREAKMGQVQAQSAQAEGALRQANADQIRNCGQAVETMEASKLGIYAHCRTQPEMCKAMANDPYNKPSYTACSAKRVEFCKRYQSHAGFLKAKAGSGAAEACGLSEEKVRAALCPAAVKKEDLPFLGRHCLVEAKPLAEKHCAGRDYTALRAGGNKDKYSDFCLAYLSKASLAESPRQARPARAASQPAQPNPADAVQQGITEGIGKLKGLFGR